MKQNRRNFIKGAALVSIGTIFQSSKAEEQINGLIRVTGAEGKFELPPLGYAFNALEPFIDAQTMQIHHGKHHQAYITKLNEAIDKEPSLKGKSLEELLRNLKAAPESVRGAIRNHGGGHWNHSFFWPLLKKDTQPGPKTLEAINQSFGSMEQFKTSFAKAAMGVFGSGWAWVNLDKGKLVISTTPNQDNPLMDSKDNTVKPILGLDVWEHAYYLNYQNKRAEYVEAFWKVLNWEQVEKNLIA